MPKLLTDGFLYFVIGVGLFTCLLIILMSAFVLIRWWSDMDYNKNKDRYKK